MFKRILLLTVLMMFFYPSFSPAEVRFGKNVRVGGHDFSNRTYNKNKTAQIYLYDKKPKNEGCKWVKQRDKNGKLTGKKTQICHLQKK